MQESIKSQNSHFVIQTQDFSDMSNVVRQPRPLVRKLHARPQQEGVGATVRRSIGRSRIVWFWGKRFKEFMWEFSRNKICFCFLILRSELKYFDPFLVLDEFSGHPPLHIRLNSWTLVLGLILMCVGFDLTVTAPAGFPDHPHRGFMTSHFITILNKCSLADFELGVNSYLSIDHLYFYHYDRIRDCHLHAPGNSYLTLLPSIVIRRWKVRIFL